MAARLVRTLRLRFRHQHRLAAGEHAVEHIFRVYWPWGAGLLLNCSAFFSRSQRCHVSFAPQNRRLEKCRQLGPSRILLAG